MGATEKIADWIAKTAYEDLPRQAVERAKRTALDTVAAALAGCTEPAATLITGYVKALDGSPQSGVIGSGFRAAVAEAALANGTIAHVLDYDDCGMKMGHPSVMVLPALFSLGQQLHASGREVLTAYILGLEIEGKIALHADFNNGERSLNNQSWYGSLGAAAACAKLLGLDAGRIRMALGIVTNLACGVSANHGFGIYPTGAGNACRNGVAAALMAREGITAHPDIVEARNGFLHTLVGPGQYDITGLAEGLGNPFYITAPGIGLKKYPSCYHTHRAIDAVLQLMAEHHLTARDVTEVDVGTSKRALRVLAYSDPQTPPETPYQAKFSMPFCIAAALVDGKVNLETFTPEKLSDPGLGETRKKVQLSLPDVPIWPGLADVGPDTVFVGNPVTIRTADRSYSARVDILHGDPASPLTDEEILVKYRDCAGRLLKPADIEAGGDLLLNLERLADIGELMDLLTGPVR